jgi:hypothetical protein
MKDNIIEFKRIMTEKESYGTHIIRLYIFIDYNIDLYDPKTPDDLRDKICEAEYNISMRSYQEGLWDKHLYENLGSTEVRLEDIVKQAKRGAHVTSYYEQYYDPYRTPIMQEIINCGGLVNYIKLCGDQEIRALKEVRKKYGN